MRYGAMNFPVRPVLQELKEIATLGDDSVIVLKIISDDDFEFNFRTPLIFELRV